MGSADAVLALAAPSVIRAILKRFNSRLQVFHITDNLSTLRYVWVSYSSALSRLSC